MSIANNELWVKTWNGAKATLYSISGFIQTLVNTELRSDGWTVFTFDASLTKIGDNAFYGSNLGVSEVIMPETVTEIGDNAFLYQYSLKSINFPDALTTIGTYALYMGSTGNNKLTEIILGPNLTYIDYQAFYGLNALTKIKCKAIVAPELYRNGAFKVASGGTLYYPEGADYSTWLQNADGFLGYYGWSGETFNADFDITPNQILRIKVNNNEFPDIMESTLTDNAIISYEMVGDGWIEYYFNSDLTNIPKSFFYNQTNVIDFELPESCTSIGDSAFENTGLIDVTIPDRVTSLGTGAFTNCASLTSFKLGNGVKELLNATLYNCPALASIDLGKVEKIHNSVFNRAAIEEIVLPATLKQMGTYLFNGCDNLKTITSYATTAPKVDKTTFYFVPEFGTLNYPEGSDYSTWLSTDQYYLGYYIWNYTPPVEPEEPDQPEEPDVPVDPEEPDVPGGGEEDDDEDTESGIPNNELWVQGYYGSMTLVNFTSSTGFIQKLVSRRIVDEYTVFTFDAPLTKIGNRAFDGQDIKKVILPDTVTEIGTNAFHYCEYLNSINIGNNVETIGVGAFNKCLLETLVLGSGLKEIKSMAFYNLKYLQKITCKAVIAPAIKSDTFGNIKLYGNLYYPKGSDYSSWLSDDYAYLGNSYWTGHEMNDIVVDESTPDINPDRIEISSSKDEITSDEQTIMITVTYKDCINGIADYSVNKPIFDCDWLTLIDYTDGPIYNCKKTYYFKCNKNSNSYTRSCNIKFSRADESSIAVHNYQLTQYAQYDCMDLYGYDAVAYLEVSSSLSYCTVSEFLGKGIGDNGEIEELNINGITYSFNYTHDTVPLTRKGSYVRYKYSNTYRDQLNLLFYQNKNLIEIKFANDIQTIGGSAFAQCTSLKTITLPKRLKTIGNSAFSYCDIFSGELNIPSSVTTIGTSAFENCKSITSINIPDSVTTIGDSVFANCSGVESVTIGSGLTSIGTYAFIHCSSLGKITVSPLNTTFTSGGYDCIIDKPAEVLYVGCKNSYIPDGITTIAPGAFYGSTELQQISIPASVTYIGNEAFAECNKLSKIISYAKTQPVIKNDTFADVKLYGTLYYPTGSNYSGWLSNSMFYLGYFGWNSITTNLEDYPESPHTPVFKLEYYSYTAPQCGMILTLNILKDNISSILVNYPWWVTPTDKGDYFELDIAENEFLERVGEIEFIAVSTFGERITQTLIITQEGLEDMATGIALDKMRINYPAEGGEQRIQVNYLNPNIINEPYCSQSWVTITKTQESYYYEGENKIVERQYAITLSSTKFERQTNVEFSCTDTNGNKVSNNKLVLYQAMMVNPDDGEGETHVSAFSTVVKVKIDGTPEYSSGSDLGVGYENLIPKSPTIDGDWIHVGEGVEDTGTNTYDIVMRYPTTYDENTGVTRTGTITWFGVDGNSNPYTATTEVTQFGSDTPVDEGMITLKSLSVTLPASGGSDTFEVEYYDAKTIYDPEFEGNWATITEISSTSADGVAWNGTECVVVTKKYKVTAPATNSGRLAKVILRADINYYDGGVVKMEKDKFRVYQIAPGETEFHGVIYPFRQELTYDHKGYSTSWGSVRVGYKDMSAIDPPKINASWLKVKEIKDVTYSSKEYDKIYEYTFTLEENISSVARTAIVTFNGLNELNGYVAGEVKIVQASYNSEIDTIATNYKGYFTSMEGKLYSVALITDPNYDSYGEITLAGESPVVVSYTDSNRLYDPLRTSTCTVRVVSTQYLMNLYTGKAQGAQVILKNEDDDRIEWCGFLQPNLYNQGYSSEIEEIEFEASDCLSSLQYLKYEDYYSNGRMSVPFSYAIGDIMEKCKLIKSYYITKKQYNDNIETKDLKFNSFFISEHNFFSEEDEPWTLQEVLEETCKFFGYVCYQWGDCVYFIDYDQFTGDKKMLGYRYDKDNNWNKATYVNITTTSNQIKADNYRDTGADMSLDDVFNKVTVNCNYYDVEEVIPDLFDDELLTNRIDGDGFYKIRRYGGRGNSVLMNETYYRFYDHKNINSIYYAPIVGEHSHESKTTPTVDQKKKRNIIEDFVGANIIDMIHLNYNEANGKVGESKDWQRYLMISQLNRPWCQGYDEQHNRHWETYNFPIMEFKNLPTIYLDNRQTSTGRPGTKTAAKNYFVIDAEAAFTGLFSQAYMYDGIEKGFGKTSNQKYGGYTYDMIRGNGNGNNVTPTLCFYLEVPKAGWWNGTGWQDAKTWFEVPLEETNYLDALWATSKSVQNTVESNLFIGKAGYKIPLPAEMDSTEFMYFAIAMPQRFAHLIASEGGDNTGEAGNAYCFIKDLKISICNLYSELYGDKDMLYENIIDQDNVIEGDEIDLKITSDNGYSYSLSTVSVVADDYAETEFYFIGQEGELLKPEEAIIEKYVNQYSTPSIKENVTVDMSFTPHQLITDTYWEKDFVMIGQEIDYKGDKQTITLLQKK